MKGVCTTKFLMGLDRENWFNLGFCYKKHIVNRFCRGYGVIVGGNRRGYVFPR